MNVFIGVVLIIIGILFVLLGFAGGVLELWRNYVTNRKLDFNLPDITKVIDALTALLKQLAVSPLWLAFVAVGFFLIGFGAWFTTR